MSKPKNFGPCFITDCIHINVKFRVITKLAYDKCHKNKMLQIYPYLEIGRQLCHPHYCSIVEGDRHQRRRKHIQKKYIQKKRQALEPLEPNNNNNTSKCLTMYSTAFCI